MSNSKRQKDEESVKGCINCIYIKQPLTMQWQDCGGWSGIDMKINIRTLRCCKYEDKTLKVEQ